MARPMTPQTTPMMMYFVVEERPFHFWETVWELEGLFAPSRVMGLVELEEKSVRDFPVDWACAYLRTLMLW